METESKRDIPLYGDSVNIVRQCGSALSDVLQSKFGCVAIIEGVGSGPGLAQQGRPTVAPEKRNAVFLRSGVEVSVWKADLTNFKVDAVVNAANGGLQHYGGLALALSNAGGPQIKKLSDDYTSRNGPLQTGDAIVTDAGFLPCKKIIHAVGPHLPRHPPMSDVNAAEKLLMKAIKSILDRVREHRLQSVAIPAISSGIFNYPLPKCANNIVTAVKRYYENYSGQVFIPKQIMLVNNDDPSVTEMERAVRTLSAPHMPPSYSQSAASNSRSDAKTSSPTLQMGTVSLTLKKGKIEDQKTDVIVNTTSKHLDLSLGAISKALLQNAGSTMQQEIKKATPRGHVITTGSHRLQCKKVYHTFCPDRCEFKSQEILSKLVSECLGLADQDHHQSISFPAIGTGMLGFSKSEVAQIMSDAVVEFARKFPNKMEVYFVIYPKDDETFKAFEEQLRTLQQKPSHPSSAVAPPAYGLREDFHHSVAPTPRISLTSSCEEATREAERWLSGLLFKSSGYVSIHNNLILHFGEREHQWLSRLSKEGVSIEESFVEGRAGITVRGSPSPDVVVAALQVEAMLCNVQRDFIQEEEDAMFAMTTRNVTLERKMLPRSSQEFSGRITSFKTAGLQILKVEKVENSTLSMLFDMKRTQLKCSTPLQTMFQRIPAQFREIVSRVGFHAECAPPEDPAYGEGIYFADSVKRAMEVWKKPIEEYIHFVEAEVLTGNSTAGSPGLILPPLVGTDPLLMYDSVSGRPGVSVIFSGYQALPKYIITCEVV